MTVQELIDELQKVEDKTQKIYRDDCEWGLEEVDIVSVHRGKLYIG